MKLASEKAKKFLKLRRDVAGKDLAEVFGEKENHPVLKDLLSNTFLKVTGPRHAACLPRGGQGLWPGPPKNGVAGAGPQTDRLGFAKRQKPQHPLKGWGFGLNRAMPEIFLVETKGLEPSACALRTHRSPS